MQSFLFASNATLPIILTVLVGYIVKRVGILTPETAKILNALVFRVLLPTMLFLNVYGIESISSIDLRFVWYALGITLLLFFIFIPVVNLLFKKKNQRGVILQAIFRSNYALIGIPLATALYGEEGAAIASLLAAFIIPTFNILSVICLSIYSDTEKPSVKSVLVKIIKNPLIIAVLLSIAVLVLRAIFVKTGASFRLSDIEPIFKVMQSLSSAATPLALIALGAGFEFSAIPELKLQIIFGALLRCLAVPVIALTLAYAIGIFNGAHFAAFVAMFATPVAVSTVPMTQEMKADHALAGQLVVWTTILSAFVIFLSSFVLKLIGVFA